MRQRAREENEERRASQDSGDSRREENKEHIQPSWAGKLKGNKSPTQPKEQNLGKNGALQEKLNPHVKLNTESSMLANQPHHGGDLSAGSPAIINISAK